MAENSQSRKWQLTINNPKEHNITYELLKEQLEKFALDYYCMCTEIGNESHTEHIHIFMYSNSPIRFSTIKSRIPTSHIEKAYGSIQDNIDYIKKEGRWTDTEKKETSVEGSFFQKGEVPSELIEKDAKMGKLLEEIKDGKTTIEIIEDNPEFAFKIKDIDTIRQTYLNEKYSRENRDIICTYIYGKTGVGKTRSIFKKFGAENICRITSYKSSQGGIIFDNYDKSQEVLVFEEFNAMKIPVEDMLNYLDIYPITLPARYNNKVACYTHVFITSNIPFDSQYSELKLDLNRIAVYYAWQRRIHNVYEMKQNINGETEIIVHKETKKEDDLFESGIIKKEECKQEDII